MERKYCISVMALSAISFFGAAPVGRQARVEKEGQDSKLLLEQAVSGHLTDLNGKYKLRLTEVTYKPGGFIGVHHHAGPGIRYVLSGTLSYTENGTTKKYGPGTYFYESGDVAHTAKNDGKKPVRLINFELLPTDWKGATAIPAPH